MAGLALEAFDFVESPGPIQTYEEGYEAGMADGRAEAAATKSKLRSELLTCLTAISQSQRRAEEQVLASLAPLFEAIAEQLLPAIAREAIGQQIVEVLLNRAESVASRSGSLRLSQADYTAVSEAVAASGLHLQLIPDPSIEPCQAVLGDVTGQEEFLDLQEVVTALRVALEALSSPYEGGPSNG